MRLLLAGADPDIQETSEGNTPLHVASQLGQLNIVNGLLAYNANTDIQDKDGDTAL